MKAFLIRRYRFYRKLADFIFVPSGTEKAFPKPADQSNSDTVSKSGSVNTSAEILKDSSTDLQQNASPVCYAKDPEVRDEYRT